MAISGEYVMRVWLISLTLRVPTFHLKKKNINQIGKCAEDADSSKNKKDKCVFNL